jgi:hypothetical protein
MQPHLPNDSNPGLERTRHQLRATGANRQSITPLLTGVHDRGYLPHVKREGASYFVTFRLADSLPKDVLLALEQERAQRPLNLTNNGESGKNSPGSAEEIARDFRRKLERYLIGVRARAICADQKSRT